MQNGYVHVRRAREKGAEVFYLRLDDETSAEGPYNQKRLVRAVKGEKYRNRPVVFDNFMNSGVRNAVTQAIRVRQ